MGPLNDVVPVPREVALRRIGRSGRPREKIDHVLAPMVNQCRYGSVGDVFDASSDQRKSLGGEILHFGGIIELTVEPRLHRVLIGRYHIHQVCSNQRSHVTGHDVLRDQGALRRARRKMIDVPREGGSKKERRRDRHPTPWHI